MGWGDGQDYARQSSQGKDYGSALSSRIYNPDQKVPTPEQADELRALLNRHAERVSEASLREGRLRTEAYLRAIDAGEVRSFENPPIRNPIDPTERMAAKRHSDAMKEGLLHEASRQKGTPGESFIFTMLSSSEPDGVSRTNFIFVERTREPDYFRALDEMKQSITARDNEVLRFFHRL